MLVSDMSHIICMNQFFGQPGGFDFFFGISNPGCYTKNPYKHPIFFPDSYSPAHKLSKSPLNGQFSSEKNITGCSPLNADPLMKPT